MPWLRLPLPVVRCAIPFPSSACLASADAWLTVRNAWSSSQLPALADDGGFSQVSYYTTLALYVVSFPGIYSLVKRSVKSKVVRKTYEVPGPGAQGGRATREVAGDIVAFFQVRDSLHTGTRRPVAVALTDADAPACAWPLHPPAPPPPSSPTPSPPPDSPVPVQANNYKITDAADVIVFEGVQAPVVSRAAFLTFCVAFALASLALVVTIVEQQALGEGNGLGNLWYASMLASPVAGKYYLDNAERSEQVSVKIVTEDDEMSADIIVQGDEEEIERFQKTLDLREKGMLYVKGILS